MNNRITLRRADKIPYGAFVAFENLKYLFPYAELITIEQSPAEYNSIISDYSYKSDGNTSRALYVIISPAFYPNEKELASLMRFVGAGNHVFVSSFSWSRNFLDSMNLKIDDPDGWVDFEDSLNLSVTHPVTYDSSSYSYPGISDNTYFNHYDTNYSTIIGRDGKHFPNVIRQKYQSGGSLFIQSDPLAFSNFFLLHKNNNDYFDQLFSYFPQHMSTVIWDQHFRYGKRSGRAVKKTNAGFSSDEDFNSFQVILQNEGLRTAFWLVLLLFALIYLFESKRRQRIIPLVTPHRNSSLDFVKTVGRLYHQYHDNKNLGLKMSAHLMDYIRHKYNLSTSVLDEIFITNLAFKSGFDRDKLHHMIYRAKMINDFSEVSDEDLMEFHKQTEAFYKNQ